MALFDIRSIKNEIAYTAKAGGTRWFRLRFSFFKKNDAEVDMSEYRALYRKWRPRDFDDVCGQNATTDILKYEVAQNKISHAYLFCGSRGTGKTSCAKILAKAVNCLNPKNGNPCNACEACISIESGRATDVIEMDAASNNGVDNVRDLKEEIAFMPAELKYRVYIIDEVHMMSGSAFNALLKTLEEPPHYVVFILATTELHKLPTTIVSRCQRFDFKRISTEVIMQRLFRIAQQERIELREDGARVIARASLGGMRDAVSLLELCAGSHKVVDSALVRATVGSGNRDAAYRILSALADGDFSKIYGIVSEVVLSGSDLSVFWQELLDAYRDMMVVKNYAEAKAYLDLTEDEYAALQSLGERFSMQKIYYHTSVLSAALADMQRAGESKRSVAEIALTRMCEPKLMATAEALAARLEQVERELSRMQISIRAGTVPEKLSEQGNESPAQKENPPTVQKKESPTFAQKTESVRPYDKWGRVIARIGELKPSLSSKFIGASVECSERAFFITMRPFFAKSLSASAEDVTLVKGAFAEIEGCAVSEITLQIKEKSDGSTRAFAGDLQSF